MNETFTNIAGWIPAIILPIAALIQLIIILRKRDVAGLSAITWLLFGIANLGLYIFTEKYLAPQCIIGMLGTAVLNFTIVGMILSLRKEARLKKRNRS